MARRPRRDGWSSRAHQIVDLLFVYGTLRAGQPARSMIADRVASAVPATMTGRIYALPGNYPGMLPGDDVVIGEIVELTELTASFALLDAYEGDEFVRALAHATPRDGEPTWVWCYSLREPAMVTGCVHIASGDWVAWSAE